MNEIFGITKEEFLNPSKVKILDGIAGSAKSSNVDRFFNEAGLKYVRYTSTNKLRRDAENRYPLTKSLTVASGLFTTNTSNDGKGLFYSEEKDPECENVVIDEILQTNIKIFDWIKNHKGTYNIIICTDSFQMLAPEGGEGMYKRFCQLKEEEDSVVRLLTKTYRARTLETENYYYELFKFVSEKISLFNQFKKEHGTINFEDVKYNHNDIYICHTKDIEEYLYEKWNVYEDYDAPLIPKGCIAKKNISDIRKYPILPQNKAGKAREYWQNEHIATATRYQGSEVDETKMLYFFIEPYSMVMAREWYTVFTRLYNIENIKIVVVNMPRKKEKIKSFMGKAVVENKLYYVDPDTYCLDILISDIIKEHKDDKVIYLDDAHFTHLRHMIPVKNEQGIVYDLDTIISGGKIFKMKIENQKETKEVKRPKQNVGSLIKKEINIKNERGIDDIYREYEKAFNETFYFGTTRQACSGMIHGKSSIEQKERKEYKYYIDFESSYAHILAYDKIPRDCNIIIDPESANDDIYHTTIDNEYINFYMSLDCPFFTYGAIITGDLVKEIQSEYDKCGFRYLYSSLYSNGTDLGRQALDISHHSVEKKRSFKKTATWGVLERPYLSYDATTDQYVLEDKNKSENIMHTIKSYQSLAICKMQKMIYGRLDMGYTQADCLYFDYEDENGLIDLCRKIKEVLPNYDFRLCEVGTDKIICQTFKPIPSEKELNARRMYLKRNGKEKEEKYDFVII